MKKDTDNQQPSSEEIAKRLEEFQKAGIDLSELFKEQESLMKEAFEALDEAGKEAAKAEGVDEETYKEQTKLNAEMTIKVIEGMRSNTPPGVALGLTPRQIEFYYMTGYQLYRQGKYQEALDVLKMTQFLDPANPTYLFALASAFQMVEEWYQAAKIFMACSMVDSTDPNPNLHAADCFSKLGDSVSALLTLDVCLQRCGNEEKYAQIRSKAQLKTDNLMAQIQKEKDDKEKKGKSGKKGKSEEDSQ